MEHFSGNILNIFYLSIDWEKFGGVTSRSILVFDPNNGVCGAVEKVVYHAQVFSARLLPFESRANLGFGYGIFSNIRSILRLYG